MSRKALARSRVRKIRTRRSKVKKNEISAPLSNAQKKKDMMKFSSLRKFTSSMGIADNQLRNAIKPSYGNMDNLIKSLGLIIPGSGANKHENKFTGDRLFGNEPRPFNDDQKRMTFSDFRTEKNPVKFRPVTRKRQFQGQSGSFATGQIFPKGSDLQIGNKQKKAELNDIVRSIQENTPRQVDTVFTFPDTDFDFNMLAAVQSSIANYRKAKNKFNVQPNSGGDVFTNISNQL